MARPELLLDRYRILGKAGSGGFGTVQHCFDTRLKRDVAVKCIELSEAERAQAHLAELEAPMAAALAEQPSWETPDDEPEDYCADAPLEAAAIEHAEDAPSTPSPLADLPGLEEAQAAAQLSDPHIVTVYDFEIHDGVAYIIMEYIEGLTLTELLAELGDEVTLDQIAAVVDAVAAALETAHAAGVLHLDVKPDNVLVNAQGEIKVTDFGLAALLDASGTGTTGGGTVGFMPLEQMRQEPLDGRTDEWALASMTYEMLTGYNPFEVKGGLGAAEAAIVSARLEAPSAYWEPLGVEFDEVMLRGLAPAIDDRYPSVGDFVAALNRFLGDPDAGRSQIIALMNGNPDEAMATLEPLPPSVPLVDRIGEAGAMLIMRVLAAAAVALLIATALANVDVFGLGDAANSAAVTQGVGTGAVGAASASGAADAAPKTYGLASSLPWLFWLLVCAFGALGAYRPHIGIGVAWLVLSVVLALRGLWWMGLGLAVITVIWWRQLARAGIAEATIGGLQPLLGSIGFAATTPVVAGAVLNPLRALGSTLFAILTTIVFASFGSGDMMGWNALINLSLSGVDVTANFLDCVTSPATWCIAGSWIAATLVLSLCCTSGPHGLDVAGAFLAAVLLVTGVCVATWFSTMGMTALPSVYALVAALIPGIIGIILAILDVTSRARAEE